MGIYDFMTLLSWGDAKVILLLLFRTRVLLRSQRVLLRLGFIQLWLLPMNLVSHQKKEAGEISSEAGSSAPEVGQAEGVDEADLTDFCAKIENSLQRDEGTSARAASTPTSHLGAVVSGYVGKARAKVLRHQVDPLDSLARSALARDVEYDQILEDDFGTATRGEEIDLTLFPLTSGPYQMSYPYKGASSPPYIREEWNGRYAPEGLVSARNHLQEKFDQKAGYVKVLRSKVIDLDGKLERMQKDCDALVQENRELRSRKDVVLALKYRFSRVQFGSGLIVFVRQRFGLNEGSGLPFQQVKELHTEFTDARVASISLLEELSLTDAKLSDQALVVRDLQNQLALEKARSQGYKNAMDALRGYYALGRIDVEFKAAVQNVSNFHVGAKADFDKALVDFPTTPFPFLNKIVTASG
nr:hypothetical protein [Tanacetum cinerariifolium]